jgi:BRCT domain type II-containing protein
MVALSGFLQAKAYGAQKKAAGFEREAAALQQKQVNLQNARAKRDAVREARLAFGTAQNAAANQGVSGSSSSMGGLSSITSQVSDNISFLDKFGLYSDQAATALGNASRFQSKAAGYTAASNFVQQATNTALKFI